MSKIFVIELLSAKFLILSIFELLNRYNQAQFFLQRGKAILLTAAVKCMLRITKPNTDLQSVFASIVDYKFTSVS